MASKQTKMREREGLDHKPNHQDGNYAETAPVMTTSFVLPIITKEEKENLK